MATPETRILAARAAALTRWGKLGSAAEREAATQPARDGQRARFEREADPEGKLSPQERARAADRLQQAHMIRMSLKAAAARRRAREAAADLAYAEAELSEIGGSA
jgi:hypothetical protein